MLFAFFDFLFNTFPLNLLFLEVLYRPFFNLLVVIYQLLGHFMLQPDMGVAVIFFTIALRIILLPLSLREERSEEEKREIERKMREIKMNFKGLPIQAKEARRQLLRQHQHIFWGEVFNIGLQIWIALMLWRIFSVGLEGEDFHLLYSFIHPPVGGFNLTFLGQIDLAHPSFSLNLLNALLIFVIETLNLEWGILPVSETDRLVQFIFPAGAFLYLYNMPAGKKLFIITTLLFTLMVMVWKELREIGRVVLAKKKR